MGVQFNRNTIILLALCGVSVLILLVGLFFVQQQESVIREKKQLTQQRCDEEAKIYNRLWLLDPKAEVKAEILNKFSPNDEFSAMIKAKDDELALEKSLSTLKKHLMNYEYIPTYLSAIQNTVIKTGNHLLSISPGDEKPIDFNDPLWKPAPTANTDPGKPATAPAVAVVPDAKTTASDAKAAKYQAQVIGLNIKGNYASIVRLLDALRKFPQLVYVRTLIMNPVNVNGNVEITVGLQTYALILPDQNETEPPAEETKPVAEAPR